LAFTGSVLEEDGSHARFIQIDANILVSQEPADEFAQIGIVANKGDGLGLVLAKKFDETTFFSARREGLAFFDFRSSSRQGNANLLGGLLGAQQRAADEAVDGDAETRERAGQTRALGATSFGEGTSGIINDETALDTSADVDGFGVADEKETHGRRLRSKDQEIGETENYHK
jgi:hypothetical protein